MDCPNGIADTLKTLDGRGGVPVSISDHQVLRLLVRPEVARTQIDADRPPDEPATVMPATSSPQPDSQVAETGVLGVITQRLHYRRKARLRSVSTVLSPSTQLDLAAMPAVSPRR
jgi:hypothetical protein